MLPKNKKLRRQRKEIQNEFSEEIESDIVNDSKPVERPAEMDDIDFYFEGHDPIIDPHQPLDDGCQITY
jgi:hypothetical protein